MSVGAGWAIMGCWLVLSIILGVLVGKFIKFGDGR